MPSAQLVAPVLAVFWFDCRGDGRGGGGIGLALGSWLGGRKALWFTVQRAIMRLECMVAIWAGLSPWLFPLMGDWFAGVYQATIDAPIGRDLARFGFVLILLVPATMAMGAVVPFAIRAASTSTDSVGRHAAWVYGINTGGAVVGALVAGFLLLPGIGSTWTSLTAAGINVVAGCLLISWRGVFLDG